MPHCVCQDPVDLGWRPYVRTWIQRLPREMPESGRQHIMGLFEHSVERGLGFVQQYHKHLMLPTSNMNFVTCLCNILATFLDFMAKHGGFGQPGGTWWENQMAG